MATEGNTSPFGRFIHHIDRNNSLDVIRYVLAIGVLVEHFNFLCDADIPWVISSYNCVGVFFAISGFVLIGRLMKGFPFKEYAVNRTWRIFPSYFFVVLFVAISFCYISDFSLLRYFSSGDFWAYLAANLSFLNFLHPSLPGVDTDTVANAVNGSLWTMKVEVQLSLIAPLFVWLCRKYRINVIKMIAAIIIVSIIYRLFFNYLFSISEKAIYEILSRQFIGQLMYFFAGILLYCFYGFFIKHIRVITVCTLLIYCLNFTVVIIPYYGLWLEPFVVTALVLGLALFPYDLGKRLGIKHNFSYELYLCHYPMIILVNHFDIPSKIGIAGAFAASFAASMLFAYITYRSVGRLYLKHNLKTNSYVPPRFFN